ncbi:MAG: VOC family protein [Vicinamibacterales bacterium]
MSQGLVVFADDMMRVAAFYQQTLGLAAEESESTHVLLRGGGLEVIVHAIHRGADAGTTPSVRVPPEPRVDQAFKPTFIVASLDAVREAALRTGGHLKSADGAWHFRGCTVRRWV